MLKKQWKNKKQENLVVFGVLAATLLAVFLAKGDGVSWVKKVVGRLTQPAIIKWENPNGEQGNAKTQRSAETQKKLENAKTVVLDLVGDLQGIYGIYVEDLETGANFGINEDKIFPAASLIKLPVFVAVYQEVEKGNLSLSTSYKLQAKDKVPGAGSMYYAPAGTAYTYEKMLELMGKQSDNTAQNVFVKLLGEEKIQAVIDNLGMKDTSFEENETTPGSIGRLFRELYEGDRGYQGKIFENLTDTIWEDRIPTGVPKEIKVAHKVGTDIGIYSDAGIVFGERPFILVIMTEEVKEAEAKEVLPRITLVIYGHLHPNP